MKPKTKTWKTEYKDMDIIVKNSWDFDHISEEIHINGKRVYLREAPIRDISLQSATGLHFDWTENGTEITVKVGSAWHLCGVACQILINGKYYYGNRVVLFAKKIY